MARDVCFYYSIETVIKVLKALKKCLFSIICTPVLMKDPKLFWNDLNLSSSVPLPLQYRQCILGYTVIQHIKDKA